MTSASPFSEPAAATPPTGVNLPPAVAPAGVPDRPRPLPWSGPGYLLHGEAPDADQVHVVIGQAALRQIEAHGRSNLSLEVGGALLGHSFQTEGRLVVEVVAALPVLTEDQGPIHFTFTADAWAQLHRDRSTRFQDLPIVGWFHTHPNLGVFFSADDVVVHSAAFVLPWHVGLVVDPVRCEACFFGWELLQPERREIVPVPGFYERPDLQPASVVDWQVTRLLGWRDADELLERVAGRVFTPPGGRPALPPLSGWWGVLLGGLSLLISLFLLLERLLAR